MDSGSSGAVTRSLTTLFQAGTAAGLSDRALLERFADRSGADDEAAEAAFAALVERHGPMVLRVCRAALGDRHEAEDAFQATFLILSSRARSIRRGDSVGSWLHGVALRVASRARWRASRRRHHERRHAEMSAMAGIDPTAARLPDDVDAVLHEEVGRLPEKYRRPVVLCYLEGLTHDQAADQLGWPVGTVRRRLAGARDRLRARLTRRGVAPSLMPAWESIRPMGSVPTRLAEAMVRGALRVGSGRAALAGIVSAEAIALMKGVSQTMTTTKLIAGMAAVLTVGLVTTGVGLLAHPGHPPAAPAAPAQAKGQPPGGDADGRSPDDQLDALLRQYDEASESMRGIARPAQLVPQGNAAPGAAAYTIKPGPVTAETKARRLTNIGKLQDISTRMLDLATRHPRTNAAERALIWLVTSDPAGSESSKRAWELLARDYVRSDRIKQVLTSRVEMLWASRAIEDLLHNASEQNPYREVRGLACYWLAELLRYRAELLRLRPLQPPGPDGMWRQRFGPEDLDRVFKQDPRALEHRAARLYDRVIEEFPFVSNNGPQPPALTMLLGRAAPYLADVAKVRLDALRRLSVGKPAPEIEGVDLDGRPMKLSDFRGKVVVLTIEGFGFFSPASPGQIAAQRLGVYRQLAPIIQGKPVAMLGVVAAHPEEHRKAVQASGLPVRFWWDPDQPGQPGPGRIAGDRPGPIRTAWAAERPYNIYVIDARGVIRYPRIPGPGMLEKAVVAVLNEPEGGPDPK